MSIINLCVGTCNNANSKSLELGDFTKYSIFFYIVNDFIVGAVRWKLSFGVNYALVFWSNY